MNKKKVPTKGQLPAIKSNTKLIITIDCRDIYKDEKKCREVSIILSIRDNKLLAKIGRSNIEVGRIDPISLEDYCNEFNVKTHYVWSIFKDLYRITFDSKIINDIYYDKWCLTAEDLSLILGYIIYSGRRGLYNLCLVDYCELPGYLLEEYKEGEDFMYIAIENKEVYPEQVYKVELK